MLKWVSMLLRDRIPGTRECGDVYGKPDSIRVLKYAAVLSNGVILEGGDFKNHTPSKSDTESNIEIEISYHHNMMLMSGCDHDHHAVMVQKLKSLK